MRPAQVRLSVIVPVYNSAGTLLECLSALQKSLPPDSELIVVDDSSTDESRSIAEKSGARVISNDHRKGPAGARNAGAKAARGEILHFIDADVLVRESTLQQVLQAFQQPELSAIFGSYDDSPSSSGFVSQYKNLLHHYVHQTSKETAVTFWAGCGAIRRNIFLSAGGFNETEYRHPSIEDIELGLRLYKQGHPIRLDKTLQVKHMKHWSWHSLLVTDIFYRAYPWSQLILRSGMLPGDLNLQRGYRMSALLVGAFFFLLPLPLLVPAGWKLWLLLLPGMMLAAVLYLNRKLYRFFLKRRGWKFLVPAVLWHLLYYLYSGLTFVLCWIHHQRLRLHTASRNERTVANG